MHGTTSTIHQQAGTALLAVVQHLHDQQLGTPVSITTPSPFEPNLSLFIESRDLPRWLDTEISGLTVDHEEAHEIAGRIGGRRHERVVLTGRLAPFGIRIRLTAVRAIADLTAVPSLPGASA